VFLKILVAVDGSPPAARALEEAADLARSENSLLTLLTVAPPVSALVSRAGVSTESMRDELDEWAGRVLRAAAATLPDDVVAHTLQRRGHAGPEIVAEVERGAYDLLVLGTRGRGRAQEGLLGSVNGYVHFHARVPVLSVPGPD
jgi:nucleotide-binding universal stress UspA family protein